LFEILIETLSALEADIARNFNVISTKFSAFHNEYNKLKFEVETMNSYKSSNEKKFESIENRLTYCSERDDDIWKTVENLSSKVQSSHNSISEIETKIHEMAMVQLAEESGRDEAMSAKYASLKEVEEVLTQMQEYNEGLEDRANKHEDRLRRLENYTQNDNLEKNLERR
jgi:chromosome segregation ATPase